MIVTILLLMTLVVFAAVILRANETKRNEARVPLYIENLRARRRRR